MYRSLIGWRGVNHVPHEAFEDVVDVEGRVGDGGESHRGPCELLELRLVEATLQREHEANDAWISATPLDRDWIGF